MAKVNSASGTASVKYALFEFQDLSVEVGEVKWIKDQRLLQASDSDSYSALLHEIILSSEEVTVEWPKKGGKGSADITSYLAIVLAVNASREKLLEKRNRVCDGEGIKTDVDQGTGRGKRKKKPRKVWSSNSDSELESMRESSDDDDDDDDDVVPLQTTQQNVKRVKSAKTMSQCSKMAAELRRKMQDESAKQKPGQGSEGPFSSLSGPERNKSELVTTQRVEKELAKERAEKAKLNEILGLVKDIPQFITRVEQFMTDMEPLLAKIKKSKQPHSAASAPNSPTCSWTGAENSSTSPLPDDLKDKVRIGTEVSLTKRHLANCNHMDPGKLTGDLMMAWFGREMLLSSSLTGMKNKEGKSKPPLNKDHVADIIGYVRSKFPAASPQFVRQVMTNKLSNEAKRQRNQKKKLDPVDDEPLSE